MGEDRTMGAISYKSEQVEITSSGWYHDCRGYCLCELDINVISVGTGRLRGSFIWRSGAYLLRSPQTAASLLTKGVVG